MARSADGPLTVDQAKHRLLALGAAPPDAEHPLARLAGAFAGGMLADRLLKHDHHPPSRTDLILDLACAIAPLIVAEFSAGEQPPAPSPAHDSDTTTRG